MPFYIIYTINKNEEKSIVKSPKEARKIGKEPKASKILKIKCKNESACGRKDVKIVIKLIYNHNNIHTLCLYRLVFIKFILFGNKGRVKQK